MKNLKQLKSEERIIVIIALWLVYGGINLIAFVAAFLFEPIKYVYIAIANIPAILIWQYYIVRYYMGNDKENVKIMYLLSYCIDLTMYLVLGLKYMVSGYGSTTEGADLVVVGNIFGNMLMFMLDIVNVVAFGICNIFILIFIVTTVGASEKTKKVMRTIRNILFAFSTFMIFSIEVSEELWIPTFVRYIVPWFGIYVIQLKFALIDIYKLITKK